MPEKSSIQKCNTMYIKSSQKNETLKHSAVLSLSSKTLETINKFSYCCLRNAQVCRGTTAGTFAQTRKKELVMQLLLLLFVCTKDTCTFFLRVQTLSTFLDLLTSILATPNEFVSGLSLSD